jgi:hypothetical protein
MPTCSVLRRVLRIAGVAFATSVFAAGPALLQESTPPPAAAGSPEEIAALASPAADAGVIAYLKRSTQDIRLINPDGSSDRPFWTSPDSPHLPYDRTGRRSGLTRGTG